MKKLVKFFEKYEKIKKPIQTFIYLILGVSVTIFLVQLILGIRSCEKSDNIEAKYFIGDNVIVHESFNVKVVSARTVSEIEILKKNNSGKTLNGNFIAVEIEIYCLNGAQKHNLDENDFKLKDHTGVYLPLNTIMTFFNIDAVDMYVNTNENGFIISDVDFKTKEAIKDYSWFGKEISIEKMYLTIYFEMDENYKVEEDIMVLEVDLFWGVGTKTGEDIILVVCDKQK